MYENYEKCRNQERKHCYKSTKNVKTYEKNVCAMLRRRGLALKYEHPGIYCIKLDGQIVYIGKSENMLVRVA